MRKKSTTTIENVPLGVLPPPELLDRYAIYGTQGPIRAMDLWAAAQKYAYRYAMMALVIGGFLGGGIITGFVFLVMHGFPKSATGLLSRGVLGMVAGFRTVRLHQNR